ncbi:MAG: UDP-N-acetylglucosamine 2-epimerase [bacterium]|nr:UDP-N-acetylglucosamine 2-epimerase [bacterium]
MKRIVFGANDMGGILAIAPVIKKMRKARWKVLLLCAGPAIEVARKQHIPYVSADHMSLRTLEKKVIAFKPDSICTGTSHGLTVERYLFRIARDNGIPIIAIIDAWINYKFRFGIRKDEAVYADKLPDYVLVMDERAKKEMIREGFPPHRIVVTGNPYFETLKQYPLPAKKNQHTILFIDERIFEFEKKGTHQDMAYNEIEVFRDIVDALTTIRWNGILVLKLHPGSHDMTRFDEIIKKSTLRIKKMFTGTLYDALRASGLVIGMMSAVLFEAALGGKMVVSYQPNLKKEQDALVTNQIGLSHAVYQKKDLLPMLKKVLLLKQREGRYAQNIRQYTKSNATNNVIRFIKNLTQ